MAVISDLVGRPPGPVSQAVVHQNRLDAEFERRYAAAATDTDKMLTFIDVDLDEDVRNLNLAVEITERLRSLGAEAGQILLDAGLGPLQAGCVGSTAVTAVTNVLETMNTTNQG